MSRVIILEGPDGAGKTYLANQLVEKYGFVYEHCDKPKPGEDLFFTYTQKLMRAVLNRYPVVIDRLYLGEMIYGPVMRGESRISFLQARLLNRLKNAYGAREILCLPNYGTCLNHWASGRPEYVQEEQKFQEVYHRYSLLQAAFCQDSYDWTDPKEQDTFLKKFFEPRRMLPHGLIGSPEAEMLIVGEQVNLKVTKTDHAFYSDKASSGFLNSALACISDSKLAFCNAVNPLNIMNDINEYKKALPNFRIAVALGRKSESVLTVQGVDHVQLPHPAYVKRFSHGKLEEYASKFKEVLEMSRDRDWKKLSHSLAGAAKKGNGVRQRQVAARAKDKRADSRATRRDRPAGKRAGKRD